MTVRPASTHAADRVRSRRSLLAIKFFGPYFRWYARRHFHAVRVLDAVPELPSGQPVIVYSNHPSWWDPVVMFVLGGGPFRHRIGYGPIAESGLRQYRVLERLGLFGIDLDDPRGAVRFLRVSLDLLADPRVMLWMLPQGQFTDARKRPLGFRPGLAHLARKLDGAVILPMALEYPFWDDSTPEALIAFGAPIATDPARSVDEWTALLEARLSETMDRLTVAAVSRESARFQSLLDGSAGVGGIYDLWRRLVAWGQGKRFEAGHQ